MQQGGRHRYSPFIEPEKGKWIHLTRKVPQVVQFSTVQYTPHVHTYVQSAHVPPCQVHEHTYAELDRPHALQKLEECMGRKDEEEVKKIIREVEEWELVEVTGKVAGLGITVEGR